MEDRESKIRGKLERVLHQRLSESLWEKLRAGTWIKEHLNYQDGNEMGVPWDELREHVASELRYEKELYQEFLTRSGGEVRRARKPSDPSTSPSEQPKHFKVSFNSWESARATAHTMHVAELAGRNLSVQAFREKVLGDEYPLNALWAEMLVSSPAAAFFPLEWFQDWGIPVVGHLSEIEGEYADNRFSRDVDHRVTVQFDFSAVRDLPERSWLLLKGGKVRARYALGPPPSSEKVDVQRVKRQYALHGTEAVPPKLGFILNSDERPRPDYLWPGSVLAELKELSKTLARLYWRAEGGERRAAQFVLTGVPTLVLPLEVETRAEPQRHYTGEPQVDWFVKERASEASIRLTVHPWMPADRVREIYRDAQQRIMGDASQPWERNLKVYIFVKENGFADREGESVPFDMYNAQAPEKERYKKPHGFWQAYNNAKEKVENFHYRQP